MEKMETFSYNGKELVFPNEVKKWFVEFINYYSIPYFKFFDTLEKLGFTFPVKFDDNYYSEANNCLLAKCHSSNGNICHYMKLDRDFFEEPILTFVDVMSGEESSYQFVTGRPIRYLLKTDRIPRIFEFKYTYSNNVFPVNDSTGGKLVIDIDFENYEFKATLSNVHINEHCPIPNILDNKTAPHLGAHVGIFDYLLYLDHFSPITMVYKTLGEHYLCNDIVLDIFRRSPENPNETFSTHKLEVQNGSVNEYAINSSKYNGTFHVFKNGTWFFNSLKFSVHFSHENEYSVKGDLSESDMKMLPGIVKKGNSLRCPEF